MTPQLAAAQVRQRIAPGDLMLLSVPAIRGALETVEKKAAEKARRDRPIDFRPQEGPQTLCWELDDTVDVIGYGGSAGGGKSGLACGLALTKHHSSLILRQQSTQLGGIFEIVEQMVGNRDGFNANQLRWRGLPSGKQIDFGGVNDDGDESKYRGRPHDLLVFDEAAEFREQVIRFLQAWCRSTRMVGGKLQKCTTLLCFNPPTTVEGEWIIKYFAPWLDPDHPNPAAYGEIRYFAMVGEEEREFSDDREFVLSPEKQPVFDFDRSQYLATQIVRPQSRTFVGAKVTDNKYLGEDYIRQLQSLPEPWRSQMLEGKFTKLGEDQADQLIPTTFVRSAVERWQKHEGRLPDNARLISIGLDVARGTTTKADNTVAFPLYEGTRKFGDKVVNVLHFAMPKVWHGMLTCDGAACADLVIRDVYVDGAVVNVDGVGYGVGALDMLRERFLQQGRDPSLFIFGINNSQPHPKDRRGNPEKDKTGLLQFISVRAMHAYRFREMLDPRTDFQVELPPIQELISDLCTPRHWLSSGKVRVELKDDVKKRLPERRSTDYGDAAILAAANRGEAKARRKLFIA